MKIGINKAHFPVTVLAPANVSVSGCKVAASAARAACRKTPGSAIQDGHDSGATAGLVPHNCRWRI